jgi:hypothetical protein
MATTLEPEVGEALDERVRKLLVGAVDMHCHSGPSVMARELNHVEALEDVAAAGFSAMLIKDHYFSATPITELLNKTHAHLGVTLFSGVPLNNATGGFNKYAVDHGATLGAKLVWMPTFSSKNHYYSDQGIKAGFPHTIKKMLQFDPLTPIGDDGEVKDEVKEILDLVAQHNMILSGGHLHVTEIIKVFEEAKKRGIKKLLVNHPTFIIDASYDQIRYLALEMDAWIEHSFCMYIKVRESRPAMYPPEELDRLIQTATADKTILASDLGQAGNDRPVAGFRNVVKTCINLGYSDEDIRKMISGNPKKLLEID